VINIPGKKAVEKKIEKEEIETPITP